MVIQGTTFTVAGTSDYPVCDCCGKYAAQVLDAWDRQNPNEKKAQRVGKPSTLDTDAEIRRKAKGSL